MRTSIIVALLYTVFNFPSREEHYVAAEQSVAAVIARLNNVSLNMYISSDFNLIISLN